MPSNIAMNNISIARKKSIIKNTHGENYWKLPFSEGRIMRFEADS